jgi:hypothetical protein
VAKAAPEQSQGPEKDEGPEEQRKAEFRENAEHERHRRKNGADSFHEGFAESERSAGAVGLEGRARVSATSGMENSVDLLGEEGHLHWPFPFGVDQAWIVRHGGKVGCVYVGFRILDKFCFAG